MQSQHELGKQVSATNTQDFDGAECGNTTGVGSVLDHTGKYLYVQLWGAQYQEENTTCAAWQSYKIASNGTLTFLGSMEYESWADGSAYPSSVPTISSNDLFGYGMFGEEYGTNEFSNFQRSPSGILDEDQTFAETDPEGNPDGPDGQSYFYPLIARASQAIL
jgi:hypothetical protein